MKPTPTPWTLGRVNRRSQTAFIDAMHRDPEMGHETWQEMIQCNGCYDLADVGIAKAEANARLIVNAVNNYDRLRGIAERIVADYEHWQNDEPGPDDIGDIVADARALLQELDNLEPKP